MRASRYGVFTKSTTNDKRWEGGRIHRQKDGRPLFIIERQVNGKRFSLSTRAHTREAARRQLERFECDPLHYHPEGVDDVGALRMTAKMLDDFLAWQLGRGVTRKWANETHSVLTTWLEDLNGQNLRAASLRDHIRPALERHPKNRKHRIVALKAFYAWLRKERNLVVSAQDPTLDLPVPAARPEKWLRRKAVPFESVQAAADKLASDYRDILTLLAATGWHVTEAERFARDKESAIVHSQRGETLAVLVVRHKIGDLTRTPVADPEVLAAAERIRARGAVPRRLNAHLKAACLEALVTPFTFGVLRHSVATWAVEGGADPAKVSEFLHHRDRRTTARFYTDVSVPTTSVALPRLRLVKS